MTETHPMIHIRTHTMSQHTISKKNKMTNMHNEHIQWTDTQMNNDKHIQTITHTMTQTHKKHKMTHKHTMTKYTLTQWHIQWHTSWHTMT